MQKQSELQDYERKINGIKEQARFLFKQARQVNKLMQNAIQTTSQEFAQLESEFQMLINKQIRNRVEKVLKSHMQMTQNGEDGEGGDNHLDKQNIFKAWNYVPDPVEKKKDKKQATNNAGIGSGGNKDSQGNKKLDNNDATTKGGSSNNADKK